MSNLTMKVTADPGSHLDKVCMELTRLAYGYGCPRRLPIQRHGLDCQTE